MNLYYKIVDYLCRQKGYKHRDLAKKIGITEVTMSRYLRMERKHDVFSFMNSCIELGADPLALYEIYLHEYLEVNGVMDNKERSDVGGVDRERPVDRIRLEMAILTPFWMAVWATEPEREIDVRMSYSDLKVICDMIDHIRKFAKGKDDGN